MGYINTFILTLTTLLLLGLNYRKPYKDLPPKWFVGDKGDYVVRVLFIKAPVWASKYHVTTLLEIRDTVILVDTTVKKLSVVPLRKARWLGAEHEVVCHVRSDTPEGKFIGEYYTCVGLTKKLIGYNDAGVQTPNQLLNALWHMRRR